MNIYWLWLTALKGVGPVTLRHLVKKFSSPQEQLILKRLGISNPEMPVFIRDFLDIFNGNLKALLSFLCSMELEGKVMISGQTVKRIK